jgi:hypothetical protein
MVNQFNKNNGDITIDNINTNNGSFTYTVKGHASKTEQLVIPLIPQD